MYLVYLGLGSNMGNRLQNLELAIEGIRELGEVQAISSIYETDPVEMDIGERFYNLSLALSTPHDPPLLLVKLKKIEKKLGRKLPSHLEPRPIDIDILLYRGLAYEDHTVRVPHPKLPFRRFALEPLCEIAPTAVHPTREKTIASLLRQCPDRHLVHRTEYAIDMTTTF